MFLFDEEFAVCLLYDHCLLNLLNQFCCYVSLRRCSLFLDLLIFCIVHLLDLYEKFGFHFDHIYGFEITMMEPQTVYDLLPEKYVPAYHWINVGV